MDPYVNREELSEAAYEMDKDLSLCDPLFFGLHADRTTIDEKLSLNSTGAVIDQVVNERVIRILRAGKKNPFHSAKLPFSQVAAMDAELDGLAITYNLNLLQDMFCSEAEPRLVRSLKRHFSGQSTYDPRAHSPDVVLLDTNAEPFGYVKSSGKRTAYFWRDATVEAQTGTCAVPGDSFGVINFRTPFEPEADINESPLVAVAVTPETTNDMYFVRKSTFLLPQVIRKALLNEAIGHEGCEKLKQNRAEAMNMTADQIGDRVLELASKQIVIAA